MYGKNRWVLRYAQCTRCTLKTPRQDEESENDSQKLERRIKKQFITYFKHLTTNLSDRVLTPAELQNPQSVRHFLLHRNVLVTKEAVHIAEQALRSETESDAQQVVLRKCDVLQNPQRIGPNVIPYGRKATFASK